MEKWKTPQEEFWSQDFGIGYIERNSSQELYSSNLEFFSSILCKMKTPPRKILELGANIGMNVGPIKSLVPGVDMTCVEINSKACEVLEKTGCKVIEASIIGLDSVGEFDLVFTKGVLIHINPGELDGVYTSLYNNSGRYILVAEYYNPTPVAIDYRGNVDRLFKRDFAGDLLDKFEDLELVDYGFRYHRGPFPQDDISWFLMEKK